MAHCIEGDYTSAGTVAVLGRGFQKVSITGLELVLGDLGGGWGIQGRRDWVLLGTWGICVTEYLTFTLEHEED